MQSRIAIVVGVLSFVCIEVAHAVTLYSPNLTATSSFGRRLQCSVVNVSTETRLARFWIMSWNGTVLHGPSAQTSIPPGQSRTWGNSISGNAHCKVQVEGLKTDWRGTFELQALLTGVGYETSVSVPLQ
jgi:hypothetical protein